MSSVIFYGDSICSGQRFPVHKGWVNKISSKLDSVLVSNVSINGRTTRQALETMPHEIQAEPPDILLVQFGMNDCNYWKTDRGMPRVSPEAFLCNLKEIINRAYNVGVKKVFVNTNHPTDLTEIMPHTKISYQSSNARYNLLIRDACRETQAVLIDIEDFFNKEIKRLNATRENYLLPDMLHINEDGHNLYFNIVYPIIRDAL